MSSGPHNVNYNCICPKDQAQGHLLSEDTKSGEEFAHLRRVATDSLAASLLGFEGNPARQNVTLFVAAAGGGKARDFAPLAPFAPHGVAIQCSQTVCIEAQIAISLRICAASVKRLRLSLGSTCRLDRFSGSLR